APQSAHALDFVNLVGNALFEGLVELNQLLGLRLHLLRSFAQFLKQPRVLDGDDSLGSEVLDEVDLFVCEGANFLAVNDQRADQIVLLQHWNSYKRSDTPEFNG